MIVGFLVSMLCGMAVMLSGPASMEWRTELRRWRDWPRARAVYLPSRACRESIWGWNKPFAEIAKPRLGRPNPGYVAFVWGCR